MMVITTTLFAFIFGSIIGSFLNVVIHRVPLGQSVVSPPSSCPKCGYQIRWYDNIPIISWALLLRAKCRQCKTPISARYALVEALTGVLSAGVWLRYTYKLYDQPHAWLGLDWKLVAVPYLLYFTFICLCVVICFIDFEHTIIPHGLSIPGIVLGLISPWVLKWVFTMPQLAQHWPPLLPMKSVIGALAGAFIVISIFVLYFVLRGVPGMGGGDVTLMAMVGAWLGWPALFFVFLAASLQGVVAAGIAMAFGSNFVRDANEIFEEDARAMEEEARKKRGDAPQEEEETKHEEGEPEGDEGPGPAAVPFGPFIVLAALEYYFFGQWLPESIRMSQFYFY